MIHDCGHDDWRENEGRSAGSATCRTCGNSCTWWQIAYRLKTQRDELRAVVARQRRALDELYDGPPVSWVEWFERNKAVYDEPEPNAG
jgi:hypothetical protein